MARKARLTKKNVTAALHKFKGGVYLAADELEVSPAAVYMFLDKYPDVKAVKESYRKKLVDKAEYQLHDAVEAGDPWAVKYSLATQGKGRGYTERQEISGPDGAPLVTSIEIVRSKDAGDG